MIAVQAALRQREVTGRGQHIDMALFDTAVAITSNPVSYTHLRAHET